MINEHNITLNPDPITQFKAWYDEAIAHPDIPLPDAGFVSTVSADGYPEGRILLLKGLDERGIVFYTNANSQKGQALAAHPKASMAFHWEPLGYQVRFQGDVEVVSDAEADAYFATRPRQSQIGAWASQQSQERSEPLAARVETVTQQYQDQEIIPRPPHWNGYRIVSRSIEFWIDRPFRLHDRFIYQASQSGWSIVSVDP